jgi:hypothetical protein
MKAMALKMTSTPYYLIPYHQPFKNGGRLDFRGGVNFEPIGGFG